MQLASQWDLQEVPEGTGRWSNQDAADFYGKSLDEIEDSERVDGYQVSYQGGPAPNYPLVTTSIALGAYKDDQSAQQALQQGPAWVGGSAKPYDVGDAAVAWPMTSVDEHPACPCQVWVRVGRLLATVDVQSGGPPPDPNVVSPAALALARAMAYRMAEAQG